MSFAFFWKPSSLISDYFSWSFVRVSYLIRLRCLGICSVCEAWILFWVWLVLTLRGFVKMCLDMIQKLVHFCRFFENNWLWLRLIFLESLRLGHFVSWSGCRFSSGTWLWFIISRAFCRWGCSGIACWRAFPWGSFSGRLGLNRWLCDFFAFISFSLLLFFACF